ncbi:MAG: response regulator transcription factor [Pseudomonadota bacterium]
MPGKTILVVDDEAKLRKLLVTCFEQEGYRTIEAEDAASAMRVFERQMPDLVTLDLRLGADNGLDVAREIKRLCDVPIVMVTGRDDVLDRVVGLEVGADDYITKPFHVREVLARIHAVLRRSERGPLASEPLNGAVAPVRVYRFAGWEVAPERFEVMRPDGTLCTMTTAEFNLLMVFLERPKRILSREQLMEFLGGASYSPLDRTIDNQVARLRKKIEVDPAAPRIIRTVRGIGYSFTSDVEVT